MRKLALALLALAASLPASAGEIVFLYLGAPDCPYCAHWETQVRPGFLASPEAKSVRYVEVQGETLRRPIEARHYPQEFRWIYDQIGASRGVPRFVIAVDGKVTHSAYGTGAYRSVIEPALRDAVAKKVAIGGGTQ